MLKIYRSEEMEINRFLLPARSVTPSYGAVITVVLSLDDFYYLQQTPSLGTTVNNTYLTMGRGSIYDTSNIAFPEISINEAEKASDIIEDTNPPDLMSYDFDLDTGRLSLTFDEVVPSETVDPQLFTIQNNQFGVETHTLTNSSVITTNQYYSVD